MRRITREIRIGGITVGGNAPIRIQSMTKTDTKDWRTTVDQIHRLERAGCEIVRVAVPDMESARVLSRIKSRINIPLIADIHFDYRLAIEALDQGVDGLRINPGNIGSSEKIFSIVEKASLMGTPIRIGVNSGSLEKGIMRKFGGISAEAMVESAISHVRTIEDMGFRNIKISLKAPDVCTTVTAYRLIAQRVDYPLHIGITEAGTKFSGSIKSAVGLGILLSEGIGDTIRVSLTGDPIEEVRVAYEILKALNLRKRGIDLISCPTCGRCEVDLVPVAVEVERRLGHIKRPLKVAVMGCSVNGPGEAREADVGIAGGKGGIWTIFRKGKAIGKVDNKRVISALVKEVEALEIEELGKGLY
jgi:(E)-4-hydroxy-3-methylbut-2-enyl-diphosphate synthase